ncbi:hypothetical protein [Bradyrhizobium erythrophlei]|uniref:Uncharacterized protein n=1 Tax=Bradyrhizobium erythrophlei TaxID=1437360 RepID=A0A1M5NEN7_9BRAD|nr:hypothetical protein [Bradyrhizobium erythrophlei]SHG88044.1 hypothetical protein SAMN05443248_2967 [Bradyrhizobium erythrophlei]
MANLSKPMKRDVQRRIKEAARYVERQWGHGWPRLGQTLQEALVRAEILAEINRLDCTGTDPAAYRDLVEDLAFAAMQWEAK